MIDPELIDWELRLLSQKEQINLAEKKELEMVDVFYVKKNSKKMSSTMGQ